MPWKQPFVGAWSVLGFLGLDHRLLLFWAFWVGGVSRMLLAWGLKFRVLGTLQAVQVFQIEE